MYPEYAEIDGKKYKIDTDYRTALRCFEVINDNSIHDYERALAIIYLLFDVVPDDNIKIEKFLEKAIKFLECGKNNEKPTEIDMDFEQDAGYIMSSFMSDYHINLMEEKMHFWQFVELIEGLKPDCILNRVREIRTYDLSKEKDLKIKRQIVEAKKRVALKKKPKKISQEQQNMANEIFKAFGIRKE